MEQKEPLVPSSSSSHQPCRSINGNGTTYQSFGGLTTISTKSRSWWPGSYDIKVILEKTMEPWNGINGYLCYITTTLMWSGRSKHGLTIWRKEARSRDLSIAWTPTVTFLTGAACSNHKAWSSVTRNLVHHVRSSSTKWKVGIEKPKID